MKKFTLLFFIFLFSFFTVHLSMAQEMPITGKVISAEDQQPIPGVTVKIRGTSTGTISGLDGNYTINAPSNGVLVFSFVGMETQELEINGRREINVKLEEARIDLGEVVVMGYSTASKKLISGSFGVVKEEEMKSIPMRTVNGVLQGKTAGVVIMQNSGTPGAQNTIRIRGGSSINANNQPLIVVDGIPVITGAYGQIGYSGQEIDAMSDINPNDIEQITVSKRWLSNSYLRCKGLERRHPDHNQKRKFAANQREPEHFLRLAGPSAGTPDRNDECSAME